MRRLATSRSSHACPNEAGQSARTGVDATAAFAAVARASVRLGTRAPDVSLGSNALNGRRRAPRGSARSPTRPRRGWRAISTADSTRRPSGATAHGPAAASNAATSSGVARPSIRHAGAASCAIDSTSSDACVDIASLAGGELSAAADALKLWLEDASTATAADGVAVAVASMQYAGAMLALSAAFGAVGGGAGGPKIVALLRGDDQVHDLLRVGGEVVRVRSALDAGADWRAARELCRHVPRLRARLAASLP